MGTIVSADLRSCMRRWFAGPLGYVAGVDWVPHEQLEKQLKFAVRTNSFVTRSVALRCRTLASDEIVVLISSDDHEAQAAAKDWPASSPANQ